MKALPLLLLLALPASAEGPLKARVVSWDLGFKPPTRAEWIADLQKELSAAIESGAEVVAFPELFAWGLGPYAGESKRPAEFVTRAWLEEALPALEPVLGGKDVLVALGSYPHQEPGWKHAFNRATVWSGGAWHFADKLDPTQGEEKEDPPIRAGTELPLFPFRGGTAAVVICYSVEKPEIAARLKSAGVQLLIVPSATLEGRGVGRIRRTASARAVELGAAVLVSPLVGAVPDWSNLGGASLYLPDQEGLSLTIQEEPVEREGRRRTDYLIPWKELLALRTQGDKAETRPFLSPSPDVRVVPAPAVSVLRND